MSIREKGEVVFQRSPTGRTGFVEVLHDRSCVMRTLDHLLTRSTSVRGVLSSRGGVDSALLGLMTNAAERGRLLLDPPLARHAETIGRAARHVEIRVHTQPARHMLVFDDRSAVLPLDASDLNAGAVLLRCPLSTPYGQLFELMWSDAETLSKSAPHHDGLNSRETEIIGLLLNGATDHQVAARLGMSSRTVRAVVAHLQQRFGTRSRMALGFQLARSAN